MLNQFFIKTTNGEYLRAGSGLTRCHALAGRFSLETATSYARQDGFKVFNVNKYPKTERLELAAFADELLRGPKLNQWRNKLINKLDEDEITVVGFRRDWNTIDTHRAVSAALKDIILEAFEEAAQAYQPPAAADKPE